MHTAVWAMQSVARNDAETGKEGDGAVESAPDAGRRKPCSRF